MKKKLSKNGRVIQERRPPWEQDLLAYLQAGPTGNTYQEAVQWLTNRGFTSATGKPLTIDHLRNRVYYLKKNGL